MKNFLLRTEKKETTKEEFFELLNKGQKEFSDCLFSGFSVKDLNMEGFSFVNCQFERMLIQKVNFNNANFSRCAFIENTIKQTSFVKAKSTKTQFKKNTIKLSDLSYADFSNSKLFDLNALIKCDLNNMKAVRIENCSFYDCFISSQLKSLIEKSKTNTIVKKENKISKEERKTVMKSNDFLEAVKNNERTFKGVLFQFIDFIDMDLSLMLFVDCDFEECNFTRTVLSDTTFKGVIFNETTFNKTNLENATFIDSRIINSGFTSVNLFSATYANTIMEQGTINGSTLLDVKGKGLTMSDMLLLSSEFDQSFFDNVRVESSSYNEVNFKDIAFSDKVLSSNKVINCTFNDCCLKDSGLEEDKVMGVSFYNTRIKTAKDLVLGKGNSNNFSNVEIEELDHHKYLDDFEKDLLEITLTDYSKDYNREFSGFSIVEDKVFLAKNGKFFSTDIEPEKINIV